MCFRRHRVISRWFRRTYMCFRSHRDISRQFWFPLDVSASEGAMSLDEGINWLVVNAASILIIAGCVNSTNSSASLISSSIRLSLTTVRMSSSKFWIVSSFSCSKSFCYRNLVILMADGWSCFSRVSKISSTDEMIILVDARWPKRTFRFLSMIQTWR